MTTLIQFNKHEDDLCCFICEYKFISHTHCTSDIRKLIYPAFFTPATQLQTYTQTYIHKHKVDESSLPAVQPDCR